jgi:integrase
VVDIHSLRHTCASRLAWAGLPITFAQKLLGHSTIELTSRFYTHTGLTEMRAALGQLEGPDAGGRKHELRAV